MPNSIPVIYDVHGCRAIIDAKITGINDGDAILLRRYLGALAETSAEYPFKFDMYFTAGGSKFDIQDSKRMNVLWLYSHPDMYNVAYLKQFSAIACSSPIYQRHLANTVDVPSFVLEEATSFGPELPSTPRTIDIIHIGNFKPYRKMVVDVADKHDITVIGVGWPGVADVVVNDLEAKALYLKSKITIDTHHEDMRKMGFMGSRAFNAASQGVVVVSDLIEYDGILKNCIYFVNENNVLDAIAKLLSDESLRNFYISQAMTVAKKMTMQYRLEELITCLRSM